MTNYLVQGDKTVQCSKRHLFTVPLQTTIATCPICKSIVMVQFNGVVVDKYGEYIF